MKKMCLYLSGCLLILSIVATHPLTVAMAQQEGWGEEGKVYAIQKKPYLLRHELSGAVGVFPMDAFYKGIGVGGGYTYHFSHHFAWEVFQFLASRNVDTGLKKDLQAFFDVQPSSFREVDYIANTNFVFVPLYGKMTWLNRKLIPMECYLTGGGGASQYTYFQRIGAAGYGEEKKYYLSVNYGIGLRVYLSSHLSCRLDLRDYMNFVDGIDHVAYFGLGLGWNFRLPRFSETEEGD